MTQPNQSELQRMVERLIIENRNSLNDPTTNEPYDVKGIANDVIELITANYTPNSEVVEREQEAYKRGYIDGGIAGLTKDVT